MDPAELTLANEHLAHLVGRPLIQFRMGYGVHLEFGDGFEITVETPLAVVGAGPSWAGEPLTAGAAGALLPLVSREVTRTEVRPDAGVVLSFGAVEVSVAPHPDYEAWQLRGPGGLLLICGPGGYLSLWTTGSGT